MMCVSIINKHGMPIDIPFRDLVEFKRIVKAVRDYPELYDVKLKGARKQ